MSKHDRSEAETLIVLILVILLVIFIPKLF